MPNNILHDWVMELGLRHQGVLLSAMRGCDIAPRHDPSKVAQRILRGAVLIPHGGRSIRPQSYITIEPSLVRWEIAMNSFSANWDHYPNHYVLHFVHAAEIIGYYGPVEEPVYSLRWQDWYKQACLIMHVNPETKEQLDHRLNADEKAFAEMQKAYKREA
jgi:hypothetical protein